MSRRNGRGNEQHRQHRAKRSNHRSQPGRSPSTLPTFLILTAVLLALSFSVAKALTPAKATSVAEANTLQAVATYPSNAIQDVNQIRVGISDDNMTALEYPATRISATGAYSITDMATGILLFSGQKGDIATITVDRNGFRASPMSSSNLTNGANAPLLGATSPTSSNAKNSAIAWLPPTVPGLGLPAPLPTPELPPSAYPLQAAQTAPSIQSAGPAIGPLLIQPTQSSSRLTIANITRRKKIPEFRGVFHIMRGASSPSKLTVVNVVSLEDYLKAVVPNELPMHYGWEAVKAQAVAARNYAIRPREKPWRAFDICDSQLCQVYLGAQTETPDSNKAISETEGVVALFDGLPILALFSSSHGGYAENYSYAFSDPVTKQFPAPPIPYLVGGPDILEAAPHELRTEQDARKFWSDTTAKSYDVNSPLYRWKREWTRAEMEAAINSGLTEMAKDNSTKAFIAPVFLPGQAIGVLKNIKVMERGTSGKAVSILIEGSRGSWMVKKEFVIRHVFKHNGKLIPSGNIVFNIQRGAAGQIAAISVQGGGFGHGVGLSQLGASWMSGHGHPYTQIIQHYYKGVSLGSIPVTVGTETTIAARPVPSEVEKPKVAFPLGFLGGLFGNQSTAPDPVNPGDAVSSPTLPLPPPRAAMTRFVVDRPRGILWVQEGAKGQVTPFNANPVQLSLNGKVLQVSPTGYRSTIEVNDMLMGGKVNTLTLLPDEQHPQRPIKAWIELIPPTKAGG